jgi:predicted nucleotidyltransferase
MSFDFKYYSLPAGERDELLSRLRERLRGVEDILFAYVHGSFLEGAAFRDLDLALWIRDPGEAFKYTVDFSARLSVEFRFPIDVQVLNEAPLPFKYRVFRSGRLLFSRDEGLRLGLMDETYRMYWDLKQLKERSRL